MSKKVDVPLSKIEIALLINLLLNDDDKCGGMSLTESGLFYKLKEYLLMAEE